MVYELVYWAYSKLHYLSRPKRRDYLCEFCYTPGLFLKDKDNAIFLLLHFYNFTQNSQAIPHSGWFCEFLVDTFFHKTSLYEV